MNKIEYMEALQKIFIKHDAVITLKNKELLTIMDALRAKLLEIKKAVSVGNAEVSRLNSQNMDFDRQIPWDVHEFTGYDYEDFEKLLSDVPGGIYSMIKLHASGHNFR